MVRLERDYFTSALPFRQKFTFQYGQIRKIPFIINKIISSAIYIPVWLDQKETDDGTTTTETTNLHSSMVRLERKY